MPEDDLELIHLTLDDALELYGAIIDDTTEQAVALLRSRSALEGALARPASYAHYQNADLALQATVLAHGIAESQGFLDGNKRLALVAMLTFLEERAPQRVAPRRRLFGNETTRRGYETGTSARASAGNRGHKRHGDRRGFAGQSCSQMPARVLACQRW